MAPAPTHLLNSRPGELPTSILTREAEALQIQSTLHYRSISSSGAGGVGEDTVIFIVLGVVCLLVIAMGFYLVSRPRAASSAAPKIPVSHLQHSPITHPPRPRCERDMGERWKIGRIWGHTSSSNLPTTSNTPTSQLSPIPAAITSPSRIMRAKRGSKTYPPIVPRPSHARRVTSLSVATSFTHITEERLSDFCASAYDLDGDLETEMLNSAREDAWVGHVLAVEDGCVYIGAGEAVEARGDAKTIVEGSAEDCSSPSLPTTPGKGGDYENSDACHSVASGGHGAEGDVNDRIGDRGR